MASAAHGRDLGDDFFGRRRLQRRAVESAAEVVDDDLGPFGREEQRVLAADAATGSGDDGDATVKCTHGLPLDKLKWCTDCNEGQRGPNELCAARSTGGRAWAW